MTDQDITQSAIDCPDWCSAHYSGAGSNEPYLYVRAWPSGVFVGEYWERGARGKWHVTERGIQIAPPLQADLGVMYGIRASEISGDLADAVEMLSSVGGFYSPGDTR